MPLPRSTILVHVREFLMLSASARGEINVRAVWPWLLLAALLGVAAWSLFAFDTGIDREFPRVVRQTYSQFAPTAYRLAEPGDTLDKIALYLASVAVVASALRTWHTRGHHTGEVNLWPAALALALISAWEAATPWPTFDGWHGWNWRAIGLADTPMPLRLALGAILTAVLIMFIRTLYTVRHTWHSFAAANHRRSALFAFACAMVAWRLIAYPDPEPHGYWPRWAAIWGLAALDIATLQGLIRSEWSKPRRWAGVALASALVIVVGRYAIWLHRPLDRLRTVEKQAIYISAMPTYAGLEHAQARHKFKTIINLFNENTPQRSARLPEELRFAREHDIRYVESPGDPLLADKFLDQTLALAQDPNAWPILVHCHGCMDRTPAWMGIYRFLVQEKNLTEIFREIEQHRGLRPKASVTLLYNRVLPARADERYARDPLAALLRQNANGTVDPFYSELDAALARQAKTREVPQISRTGDNEVRRP